MKTMKNILKVILTSLALAAFFSCDIPVGLGAKLDIMGPVVAITYPSQGKPVKAQFFLEGTIKDDTGISSMVVKAATTGNELPRQWRYQNDAGWEISNDSGVTWSQFESAVWDGTNKLASWKIYVDLALGSPPVQPLQGQYKFSVQAWDIGGFTDDNSYKSIVLTVDHDFPAISINYPLVYKKTDSVYTDLAGKLDDGPAKTDPSYLGKFITQGFDLKWQIDDFSQIYSVDIRLYKASDIFTFDSDEDKTPLINGNTYIDDQNYILKYFKNIGPPPDKVNPATYQKPNGSIKIPELTSGQGTYGEVELKNPIIDATSPTSIGITPIQIIAICYDAAGNKNTQAVLGYFVYWPKANRPWIAFSDGMREAKNYYNTSVAAGSTTENQTFMVFPNKDIKATAYQAHGVKKVVYDVLEIPVSSNTLGLAGGAVWKDGGTVNNAINSSGLYSTIFPWKFEVPDLTGYYIVRATAYSNDDKPSDNYEYLFRVNDITFPDFPSTPKPSASDALFKAISNTSTITISGIVRDATNIETLCLAWINPQSEGFAAMSQLSYFRDQNYEGWKRVLYVDYNSANPTNKRPAGYKTTETIQSSYANMLWNIPVSKYQGNLINGKYEYPDGIDPETKRRVFSYSQTISISDLNIGAGQQPLKSQMFLLRAENPAKHATIITYAPQGDTTAPVIKIDRVIINGNTNKPLIPNQPDTIEKFTAGKTIQINGIWEEDSFINPYLSTDTYFRNNFKININNQLMPFSFITIGRPNSTATTGTWTLTATVEANPATDKPQVKLSSLNDTLVIDAETKDIGGNTVQIGASWLIESEHLKLTRISSEQDDATYSANTFNSSQKEKGKIEIFLEFNKPVILTNGGTPELILSSSTGNTARAVYKTGQTQLNSRHYFVYTIGTNQNTTTNPEYLNVTGLWNNNAVQGTTFTGNNYPFTWSRGTPGDSAYEEIRITTTAAEDGEVKKAAGYYARTLPTNYNNVSTNKDYQLTLAAGKNIKIDTTAPTLSSIAATTAAGWYNNGDIYIKATFNEPVTIGSGANLPRLNLKVGTNTNITTSTADADVSVNDKTISFRYIISSGHTSLGDQISVTGYSGTITDLSGNPLAAGGIPVTTLTGIYVQTSYDVNPIVRVSSKALTNPTNNDDAITNNVNGTVNTASSSLSGNRDLSTVYTDKIFIAIRGQSNSGFNGDQYVSLEYSTKGGGESGNWITAPRIDNNSFEITQTGDYKLVARAKDRAGNISPESSLITFNWDKGAIISRIGSENANGKYSQNSDPIKITVYFRKPIYFAAAGTATIQIDAKRNSNNITLSTPVTANQAYNSIDFSYTVQNGDNTTSGTYLDVVSTNLGFTPTTNTVWDAASANTDRVRLDNPTNLLTLPTLTASTRKLDKQIEIITGSLNQTPDPTFKVYSSSDNTTSNNEANANFHGIRSDDGSYWTTLQIPFDREVTKGEGTITIIQSTTGYRIPAVMTEAQYNRLKGVSGIDTYYTKSTNGYINGTGSDTTTKYVLKYNYDPLTSSIDATFNTDFRDAEKIQINVNAQAVTLTTTGGKTTLNVRLTGSNAPQVPGAQYTVTWPAGIVSDTLGNTLTANTAGKTVQLTGVAKPFIRIKKTQDTIATAAASMSQPRLVATQPLTASARIDCRTPSSAITYNRQEGRTTVTGNAPGTTGSSNNWSGDNNNPPNNPTDNAYNNNTNMLATRPSNATGTNYTNSSEIPLGRNADSSTPVLADIQGYQWWARAQATATISGTTYTSLEAEEVAYRTVISYLLRNAAGNITATANSGYSVMESGDQVWIRGGDAIGSSSIPGFPFTWEDDFDALTNKRAGIRLMTLVSTNNSNMNCSLWKFVTWDMNATAYVDFIRGRDVSETVDAGTFTASTPAIAWQYGPKRWAYQRDGWTSAKMSYPVYAGKHRWCDCGYNWAWAGSSRQQMNFSGTFSSRPDKTNNDPTSGWTVNSN